MKLLKSEKAMIDCKLGLAMMDEPEYLLLQNRYLEIMKEKILSGQDTSFGLKSEAIVEEIERIIDQNRMEAV